MDSACRGFHTAVFEALCACLDLNPDSAEAVRLIHEAYAEPENAARPPRNRDVIYWTVLQDPAADPVPAVYAAGAPGAGGNTHVVYTTLKYQLVIVCYGPASEAYALRIRSLLFTDGPGSPRRILRKAGIYPVPDPLQPALLHEEEGSLWRKRADLTVQLRVRAEQPFDPGGMIASAPPVVLHKQQ